MLYRILPRLPETKRRQAVAKLDFPRDIIQQIAAARVSGCFQNGSITEIPEPVVNMGAANPPILLLQKLTDEFRKISTGLSKRSGTG